MKRKTGYGTLLIVLTLILTMSSGCGNKVSRYTYRDDGIKALNEGNYKDAIQYLNQAIDAKKGLVGTFDTDVLNTGQKRNIFLVILRQQPVPMIY